MKRPLTITIHVVYWFATIGWTILVIAALLKPYSKAVTHDFSLDTFVNSFFSIDFEGYNYHEAAVHVFIFAVLAALWNVTLIRHFSQVQAFRLTIIITLVLAFGTELGQFFVQRSSLLLDLMANFVGISLTIFWIMYKHKLKIVTHD